MLISCPECRAVYNISADYIPENGKKFKCAECGYIWMVYPSDDTLVEPEEDNRLSDTSSAIIPKNSEVMDIPDETPQNNINDDIDAMFRRLSHNTKNLFSSGSAVEDMNWWEKIKHYTANTFSIYMLSAFMLTIAIALSAKIIKDYRYEIVAQIPLMERMYQRFGVESIYRGKDLKIKDVQIKEIIKNNHSYIEVSGRLHNSGKQTVMVMPVKASVITADEKIEDEITEILSEHKLEPEFGALFRILLNYPSANARKIRITLEDIK